MKTIKFEKIKSHHFCLILPYYSLVGSLCFHSGVYVFVKILSHSPNMTLSHWKSCDIRDICLFSYFHFIKLISIHFISTFHSTEICFLSYRNIQNQWKKYSTTQLNFNFYRKIWICIIKSLKIFISEIQFFSISFTTFYLSSLSYFICFFVLEHI